MPKQNENKTVSFKDAFAAEMVYGGSRGKQADPEQVATIKEAVEANPIAVESMSKAALVRTLVRMGHAVRDISAATSIPYGECWNINKKYNQRTAG